MCAAIAQLTIGRKDAPRPPAEHMGMIEALEARDTELAEKRARDHTLGLAAYVEALARCSLESFSPRESCSLRELFTQTHNLFIGRRRTRLRQESTREIVNVRNAQPRDRYGKAEPSAKLTDGFTS